MTQFYTIITHTTLTFRAIIIASYGYYALCPFCYCSCASTPTRQEHGAQGAEREAEQQLTRERFQKGCGCSLKCFSAFTVDEVVEARLSLKVQYMLFLGKLQTSYKPLKGTSHPSPKKSLPYLCIDS